MKPVAWTTSENDVVAVIVPEVPVTVIGKVPVVAVPEAEIAAVTMQGVVAVGVQAADVGVNTAVTPEGRADRLMVTGAAVPVRVVTVKVSV